MNDFQPTPMCGNETAMAWDAARDELLALGQLAANWDGEGADPVKPGLIAASLRLLDSAQMQEYPAPFYIYATAGGTVMIEWHWADGRSEVANVRTEYSAEVVFGRPGQTPLFKVLTLPAEGNSAADGRFSYDSDAPIVGLCQYNLAA